MLSFIASVSDGLDRMIESESNQTSSSLFEEFISGTSWLNTFRELKSKYASLADPDALALVPDLSKLFEDKTAEVKRDYQNNPELLNKLITEISRRRKELGFDERVRKTKRTGAAKELDRGE